MAYINIEDTQPAAVATVLATIKANQPITFDNLLASLHEYNPTLRTAILADILTQLVVDQAVKLTAASQSSSGSFLPLSFIASVL